MLFGDLSVDCKVQSVSIPRPATPGLAGIPMLHWGFLATFPGAPSCLLLDEHPSYLPLEPGICTLILETLF